MSESHNEDFSWKIASEFEPILLGPLLEGTAVITNRSDINSSWRLSPEKPTQNTCFDTILPGQ